MKSLESLIPLSFAEAIGTTLLHSLWQLSALALLLMLVLAILPTGAVKWRYWSATFILGLMFLAPIATFFYCYQPEAEMMVSAVPTQFPALDEAKGVLETPSATMEGGNAGIFERITSAVQNNSYLFSGIWMMGVLFFSLRFLGGYWQVSRLRKRNLEEVPEELLQRFSILQEKLGLRRKIGIRLSSAINTPMVIGVLKPLVLLPAGLMSGLTMEQVECILVHELAHVRRWDYLVNLLQSTVEILLFFHPAIWWTSRVVRQERENCCDALVVNLPSNKVQYARALLSLEIMRQQQPALALGSQDGDLASRIRRITGAAAPRSRKFHSRGLLFGLMLLGFAVLVGSQTPTVVKAAFPFLAEDQSDPMTRPEMQVYVQDSPITKIVIKENGDEVSMDFDQKGKVISAIRNGKEVPKEEIATYQSKADEILSGSLRNGPAMPPIPPMPNFGAVPPFPPMPPMPNFGATPNVPPVPPIGDPNSANFDSKQFEIQMEQFGQQMEAWGKAFSKEFEAKDWEKFGEDAGRWAENLAGHVLSGEETEEMKALHKDLERVSTELEKTKDQRRRKELAAEQEKLAERLGELHEGAMEQNMGDFERRMEEWGKQFGEEMEKIIEKEVIQVDKMAKTIEIEMERGAAEAEKGRAIAEKEAVEAEKEAVKARAEGARAERAADIIGNSLLADQLIVSPKSYKIKINNKEFQVNGKQQSHAMHQKYQQLLEQQLGLKLSKDWVVFEKETK